MIEGLTLGQQDVGVDEVPPYRLSAKGWMRSPISLLASMSRSGAAKPAGIASRIIATDAKSMGMGITRPWRISNTKRPDTATTSRTSNPAAARSEVAQVRRRGRCECHQADGTGVRILIGQVDGNAQDTMPTGISARVVHV